MRNLASGILLLAGLSLLPWPAVSQPANPFVRPEQQRASEPPPTSPSNACSATDLPPDCWPGHKFIVVPKSADVRGSGYRRFSMAGSTVDGVPYEELAGKVVTITGITTQKNYSLTYLAANFTDDATGKAYTAKSDLILGSERAQFSDLADLNDLKVARTMFLNKHYWILDSSLPGMDGSPVLFPKYSEVAVTDVLVSEDYIEPVRLVVKPAPKGKVSDGAREGYLDLAISNTNRGERSFVKPLEPIVTTFATKDPKLEHKWSARVWSAIEGEKVFVGMTRDQARMSWGEPDHINRTSTAYGVDEQWVYGSRSYIYFRNGVLSSIQN